VDANVITQIVARRGIRLVFLNACETGIGYSGSLDFASGVAPSLVAHGVPAVVANQFPVLDPSAAAFARHFYQALGKGRSIGDAARESRIAVNYSIAGEAIDWAVPVVFARDPLERLVVAPAAVAALTTVDAVQSAVRATRQLRQRRKGVVAAVWDVNHVVPGLKEVLDKMNAAQDTYQMEVADVTAPIGAWRRVKTPTSSNGDGKKGWNGSSRPSNEGYIRADEVFAKLRGLPARLGVSQLICITNFWQKGNLYGVHSDDGTISVVSTAGLLDELRPPATSIERLVVNQLTGHLLPLDVHERGQPDCPQFYNDERDIAYIAGPLKLCGPCRRELLRQSGAEVVEAIDKLLGLYGAPGATRATRAATQPVRKAPSVVKHAR